MRLTLIVLVALSIAAHSQQATFTVLSSSHATIGHLLTSSMIRVDSTTCRASFRYCNSCSINLLNGQGMCTRMACDSDRNLADRLMTQILTEHGNKICDEAKNLQFAQSVQFTVIGDSGSMTFQGESK